MRHPRRIATAAGVLLLGIGLWTTLLRSAIGDDIVRIVAPDFDGSRGDWLHGIQIERGRETPLVLRIQPGTGPGPWLVVGLHERPGGPVKERLVLGDRDALIHYHAASRLSAFADALTPNRLALIGRAADAEGLRVGLLLGSSDRAPGARVSLPELDAPEAARILALAETLGAWALLGDGSFPRRYDGRPFLPPFVPHMPGDWNDLFGSSLEGFLPEPLASFVAARADVRRANYEHLLAMSRQLPELAASIAGLADALRALGLEGDSSSLETLVTTHFEALQGYLDSVWAENIVSQVSPDALSVALYLHTVVPIRIDAFVAKLPRKLSLEARQVIAGLQLRGLSTASVTAAEAHLDQVVFSVGELVEPVPRGPYRFQTTRIDYRLEGLAGSEALRLRLLDALRPRITNLIVGARVPADHVRSLASIDDPRFGSAGDEDTEHFLAALPRRLIALAGRGPAAFAALTPDGRALRLPAGRYTVSDDLILPPGLGLDLDAGVELQVAPGRSILVRGPLRIEGTTALPVRIRGTSESEPWGVLAAQGEGVSTASGGEPRLRSEIRFLELEGGSEDELRGVYYSGQLSVFHQDLLLSDATLQRSHADDSLNVKYGRVAIRDSSFVDSRADAIDLDWTEATIERSLFQRSGPEGDGVDVSGSTAAIDDSVFSDVQDKCVSVGERSHVRIRGSLLRRCALAVASKDLSQTEIRESLFLDNERNLAAYQKKPVFGGGRIDAEDLITIGAGSDPQWDEVSQIAVRRVVVIASAEAAAFHAADTPDLDLGALAHAQSFSAVRFQELRRRVP